MLVILVWFATVVATSTLAGCLVLASKATVSFKDVLLHRWGGPLDLPLIELSLALEPPQ
jgi:hypothetical protein